jgi:catechol 2,3-dioxygenase-like lactoylglutathione lyase family enzyme
MERSVDFYSRFLGLKVVNRMEIKKSNAEIMFLQDPEGKGAQLELTLYRDQKQFVHA